MRTDGTRTMKSAKLLQEIAIPVVVGAVFIALSLGVSAEDSDLDTQDFSLHIQPTGEVIAIQGSSRLTTAGLDAYMSRIGEADRGTFLYSRSRLSQAINNLMLPRLVSDYARSEGFLENPLLHAKLHQSAQVLISQEYFQHHARESRLDDYSVQARELYLSDPERFRTPERVDFTHVLISAGVDRSELDAMELVQALYERLGQGESLAELAAEFSDDPSVDDNGGVFESVSLDEVEERIADALALLERGQISEPLRSDLGWHVVELDQRHEREVMDWEDAEPRALEMAERRHLERARQSLVDELRSPALELRPRALAAYLEQYGIEWEGFNEDEAERMLLEEVAD